MPILTVTPEYLDALAAKQDQAADTAGSAAAAAAHLKTQVWVTHGVACGASNVGFSDAEAARRKAGQAMKQASTSLAAKLRSAANGYTSTDEQTTTAIDRQVRSS
jgi:uncharacterized protein YukE